MEIVRDIGTMAHPDVEYGRVGNHAEIVFRDCRVPADHLIGQPGRRVRARAAAARRRPHPPRDAMARARPSDRSTSCASGRCRGPRTASCSAQHQMVQDYVALSHMEIQAARLLTFQTAWKMDKYGAAAVRADLGMVKAHVSKVVLAVLDRTIQVCGALGYSSDLPVESWYRVDPVRPDRRRPRRAAQVGARPHVAEGLHAGRGLADRAHPEPPAGGRGQVGRAARARRASAVTGPMTTPPRCSASSTTRSAIRVAITVTPMAGGGSCEVFAVDRGVGALGAAAGARATPARPPPTTCCASSASSTRSRTSRSRIARPVVVVRRRRACSARRST